MEDFPKKLKKKIIGRKETNSLRELPTSNGLVDFSSNDYLGLAQNSNIFEKATEILSEKRIVQNGATGSRLLSGNNILYTDLEKTIARFHQAESALVFNSGYDANIGFFSCVPQRGDVVFYDELVHASIRDGIKMGNAKSYKFKHNNLTDLNCLLERRREVSKSEEIYIVTESVFSMDGDSPDLKALATFCSKNNYRLVIDEAHAVGIFGKRGEGLVQESGLQDQVFARVVTFGKAWGCHGAAILGSIDLKTYLVNFARSFIYTTGLPPHSVATIVAAYNFTVTSGAVGKQLKLRENIEYFNLELKTLNLESYFIPSNSAIHCCVVQGNEKVREIAGNLQKKGFDVRPILSPTVPEGKERLRFCLHSFNTTGEIEQVLMSLAKLI